MYNGFRIIGLFFLWTGLLFTLVRGKFKVYLANGRWRENCFASAVSLMDVEILLSQKCNIASESSVLIMGL
jgi:hypothetical protein